MRILAIDPGLSSGWSLWDGKTLVACGCPDVPLLNAVDAVVIEKPQAYRNSPVDPNNLITLAVQVGRYAERYTMGGLLPLYLVEPRVWKAQVSKEAHHPRIWAALDANAQHIVATAGKGKNKKAQGDLMDAVGLGHWSVHNEGQLKKCFVT